MKKFFVILPVLLLVPGITIAKNISELEAANGLAQKGIIVNQSQNPDKYQLTNNILRQEIAGVVAKMVNIPNKKMCENKFADVKNTPENSWACGRIESLLDAGIITHNQNYRPMSSVSKAEALGFIIKGLYKEEYQNYQTAHSENSWEQNAIYFAREKIILRETITAPTENAPRGFIFKVMYYAKQDLENKNGENTGDTGINTNDTSPNTNTNTSGSNTSTNLLKF